jgi:o-succinylbenzoate---CoA ligase
MARIALPEVHAADVVAVSLPPGAEWIPIVEATWEAGAALLPVDSRLTSTERESLLERALPTVVIDGSRVDRRDGTPAGADLAAVVATSGSGGQPRLVEIGRDAMSAAVALSAAALEAGPADGWLCCIPVAHIGGLLLLFRHAILGAPLTVHAAFDAGVVAAERTAVFTSLVPTQVKRLLDAGCDMARYRGILVGGSAMPPATRRRAETARMRVIATYGLTESCGGVVYDGAPLPGVDVRVGADGELQLRSPTVMRGYRFDAESTRAAFTDDGWLHTRDAGSFEADGTLRVFGRMDDAILTGGEVVWPAEVEEVLSEHPGVAEVAITKSADHEWGERVVAYVVPRSTDDAPTLDELRDFTGARIARFKAPREIVLVERIDRTALGKVRRDRLQG